MPVMMILRCPDCGQTFKLPASTAEVEIPDCPNCSAEIEDKSLFDFARSKAPSMTTVRSTALKEVERIASEQYGLTDLRGSAGGDVQGLAQGETSAPKLTPAQQKMAQSWHGGGLGMPAGQVIQMAQAATAQTRASGIADPMAMAQAAIKQSLKR